MTSLNIVKVGGSSLTVKESKHTINEDCIDWTSNVFSQLMLQNNADHKVWTVLVHGAGSFGHFEAKEHQLTNPNRPGGFPLIGICDTRNAVLTLNQNLVNKLLQKGVPAVGVSPFHYFRSLTLNESDCETLAKYIVYLLGLGFLPVLHGDVIVDSNSVTVLSGDTIVELLAKYLPAVRQSPFESLICTFVSDVSGVYLKCPTPLDEELGSGLISKVFVCPNERKVTRLVMKDKQSNTLESTRIETENKHVHDVTGGFETKLHSAMQVLYNHHECTGGNQDAEVRFVKAGTIDAQLAIVSPGTATLTHSTCMQYQK